MDKLETASKMPFDEKKLHREFVRESKKHAKGQSAFFHNTQAQRNIELYKKHNNIN